jgi:hypothetical protein
LLVLGLGLGLGLGLVLVLVLGLVLVLVGSASLWVQRSSAPLRAVRCCGPPPSARASLRPRRPRGGPRPAA